MENVSRIMRMRPSPSMAVALLALFVALSGISYAAVKLKANSVKTRNIKNSAVTGPKIAGNAVDSSKVAGSSLTNADLAASAQFDTQFDAATAGGDLTGTYPAPTLGANSVAANEITNGTVGIAEHSAAMPTTRVTHSTNQTFGSGGFEQLNFDTERYDVGAQHVGGSNNGRLTAQADGIYLATAHVEWDSNTTGTRTLSIRRNDVSSATVARHDTPGDGITGVSVATVVQLADNDYLEVEVRQDSGGNLAVRGGSSEASPEFTLTWLSPGP